MNLLQKSILSTIAYYDVLDCPLTGFEVFKYLINPLHIMAQSGLSGKLEPLTKYSYSDVLSGLKGLKGIEGKNGFYFLSGRKELYDIRIERQKLSDAKWRKVRKTIKTLQSLPYIRLIALSGSVSFGNAKQESDVDLLIVAKHKRIWTVRFFYTFVVHMFGKRRHGSKTKDRICLNHYITDKSLEIGFPSLYNAQVYAHLVPILGRCYPDFQKANSWIKEYLNDYPENNDLRMKESKFLLKAARVREFLLNNFLGDLLEGFLRFIQKRIIKSHAKKDKGIGRVLANDFQLEFHPGSPELKILAKYNENMLRLGFTINQEKPSII